MDLQMLRHLLELGLANDDDSTPQPVKEFLTAAKAGDCRRCRSFVEKGGDVNVRAKNKMAAMHKAASKNQATVVKELLRLGADIDITDEDGDTPLIFAVLSKNDDMVELLLDNGANVAHLNNRGKTAADVALAKGCLSIVYQLQGVSQCLQFDFDVHYETMTSAAQKGETDVIEFWLDHHPDRNAKNHRYGDDRTLAFVAALNGRMDVMRLLDRFNADFDIADNKCHTPLFCATQNGHLDVAKFLVEEKRSNVNHKSVAERTPIFSACANGHEEIVRLLIQYGADVNHAEDDGTTPMEVAIKEGSLSIVRLLLSNGVNLSHTNERGSNYVITAAHANRLEMLKLLHQSGCSVNRTNSSSNSTALLAACQVGNEEMTRYLLQAGSDKNHRNKFGVSPALRAAFNGHLNVLKVLGEARARLDLPNKSNETAALCAAQQNSLEMVEYLKSKGCDMTVVDDNGKTLAWYAAKNGNVELLRILADVGAPMDRADSAGCTPLIVAVKENVNAEVVQLLAGELKCSLSVVDKKGKTAVDYAKRHGRREILAAVGVNLEPLAPLRPPSLPANPEVGGCQLDASFTKWNIIYDDEKKTPLGEGGFGKVYKALTDKHQFVAVKIVKGRGTDAGRLERAIEAERQGIEILRQVRHPNIMTFLRCERNNRGHFCIFTELIAGISLFELMERQKKPLDENGIRKFSHQICLALNHLHTRRPAIIHRDIKCSNVMLTHEGLIKLIDFGLAKEIMSSSVVYTSATQTGTVCFMAPELLHEDAEGHAQYSAKSDVWALGCTVFEMALREAPNCRMSQMRQIRAIRAGQMPPLPQAFSTSLRNFYASCVVRDFEERADTNKLLEHEFFGVD